MADNKSLLEQLAQSVGQSAGASVQGAGNTANAIGSSAVNGIEALKQLFSNVQQGYNNQVGNTSQQAPQQNNQQGMSNPYQEGVLKGLKKAGEEHAYNAASMGIDPNQIMQHPVMNGNIGNIPQGNQIQQNTQTNSTPNNTQIDSGNNLTTPLQPKDLLSKLINIDPTDKSGNPQSLGYIPTILQFLASGKFPNATEQIGSAKVFQELLGKQPMQQGEKQKMLATAAFDTTKLTNESITASATAFDKVYQTLSGVEKAGMLVGQVPKRIKSLSDQLQAASGQQSRSFDIRAKGAQSLAGGDKSSIADSIKKAKAAGYSDKEIQEYLNGRK